MGMIPSLASRCTGDRARAVSTRIASRGASSVLIVVFVGRAAAADRDGPDRVGSGTVDSGPGLASSSTRSAAVRQAVQAECRYGGIDVREW